MEIGLLLGYLFVLEGDSAAKKVLASAIGDTLGDRLACEPVGLNNIQLCIFIIARSRSTVACTEAT